MSTWWGGYAQGYGRGQGGGGLSLEAQLAALSPAAWYDPSDLSTLWQDTAGTTPVTADGDPVARMDDKSGNARHLLQSTTSRCPLYKTDGALHWLASDGVDDWMRCTGWSLAQPWDRVSGVRQATNVTNSRLYGPGSGSNVLIFPSGVSPALAMNDGATACSNSDFTVGTNRVMTDRHNGASSSLQADNLTAATGNPGTNTLNGLTLFGDQNTNTVAVGEWRFYGLALRSTFTADELALLKEYYAGKAGVTL